MIARAGEWSGIQINCLSALWTIVINQKSTPCFFIYFDETKHKIFIKNRDFENSGPTTRKKMLLGTKQKKAKARKMKGLLQLQTLFDLASLMTLNFLPSPTTRKKML